MSSHHIVREKQEPALLILNMANFSPEYLGQLLEWSPTVIATGDSFEALNMEGIKVDWLLIQKPAPLLQNNMKVIKCSAGEYPACALKELIQQGYGAVNIIDDAFSENTTAEFIQLINIVTYTTTEKAYAIRSGYQKWLPAGETISLIGDPADLCTTGLEQLEKGRYKTVTDGLITIKFTGGQLFLSEQL